VDRRKQPGFPDILETPETHTGKARDMAAQSFSCIRTEMSIPHENRLPPASSGPFTQNGANDEKNAEKKRYRKKIEENEK